MNKLGSRKFALSVILLAAILQGRDLLAGGFAASQARLLGLVEEESAEAAREVTEITARISLATTMSALADENSRLIAAVKDWEEKSAELSRLARQVDEANSALEIEKAELVQERDSIAKARDRLEVREQIFSLGFYTSLAAILLTLSSGFFRRDHRRLEHRLLELQILEMEEKLVDDETSGAANDESA